MGQCGETEVEHNGRLSSHEGMKMLPIIEEYEGCRDREEEKIVLLLLASQPLK